MPDTQEQIYYRTIPLTVESTYIITVANARNFKRLAAQVGGLLRFHGEGMHSC